MGNDQEIKVFNQAHNGVTRTISSSKCITSSPYNFLTLPVNNKYIETVFVGIIKMPFLTAL